MKKKDLIKLALIGLTSTACFAAQDSDEFDQMLSMQRRNCRGYRCNGRRGCRGGCRGRRRGCNGYYGARTEQTDESNKNSCSGPGGCRGGSRESNNKNGCNGKSSCNGNGSCSGNSKCGNNQCSAPKGCSGNSHPDQKNNSKKADKNMKKRYESSF